jgi:hypothetical protein
LTLFFQAGVPAAHVRVVLPRGPFTLLNPSPGFDLDPLQIPKPYAAECLVLANDNLAAHVMHVCKTFSGDPSVSCIVFIYLDHGSETQLGISITDVTSICDVVTKPFLIILDCCQSTLFAASVLKKWAEFGYAEGDFGFLTSSEGSSLTSAIILSDDPQLVYRCPDPQSPVSYRIRHSMFSRALQHSLAYKLAQDDATTLSQWPALLNDPAVEMKHGFEAAFKFSAPTMATRTVRSFLPCGPFCAADRLLSDPAICFGSVIAKADLGTLFDEIGRFCSKRGHQFGYAWRYVKVARKSDGTIGEVATGTLDLADAEQRAIRLHIKACRESIPLPDAEEEDDLDQIPLRLFADVAVTKILALGPDFEGNCRGDREWYDELRSELAKMNAPVHQLDTGPFCRLYSATLLLENRRDCFPIIEDARTEVTQILANLNMPSSQ